MSTNEAHLLMAHAVHITVPLVPPSANKLLRMHWAKRRNLKQEWVEWLCAGMNQAEHNGQRKEVYALRHAVTSLKKVAMEICFYHSRNDDADNLWGRAKLVLDAAKYKKGAGLIFDDDAAHLQLDVLQAPYPRKQAHTGITLRPLGG